MLDKRRAPVVTTLHTILPEPDADQRRVLARVAGASSRLVAMTEMGRTLLTRDLGIEPEKISVIPPGPPDLKTATRSVGQAGVSKFKSSGSRDHATKNQPNTHQHTHR